MVILTLAVAYPFSSIINTALSSSFYGAETVVKGSWNTAAGCSQPARICRESPWQTAHGLSSCLEKGLAPFPASGEDGSGRSPGNGSRGVPLAGS